MDRPANSFRPSGIVYLVGAGPGDPELLTVKARRLLGEAELLVHDHLVCAEILAQARPQCERLVRRQEGRRSSDAAQAEIDAAPGARWRARGRSSCA